MPSTWQEDFQTVQKAQEQPEMKSGRVSVTSLMHAYSNSTLLRVGRSGERQMSLLSGVRHLVHFLRARKGRWGCSLSFQLFPKSNRWRSKASLVCNDCFPPCPRHNGWHARTRSAVVADKEDTSRNRKYLQSITIHTG